MEQKTKIRDALVKAGQDMCRLADDQKRRAENLALKHALECEQSAKAELLAGVRELVGSAEAFQTATKRFDDLRQQVERGEVV